MNGNRIKHMVVFCLKHGKETAEARKFLYDGQTILSAIPTVENFEVLNQVSLKNDYDYGFSMEFADREAYETYNAHPEHQAFVKERWMTEVIRFMEIDFTCFN